MAKSKSKNNSLRKIKAIFIKEIKDALRSNKIVFLFLLFPVFTYFLTFAMKGNVGTNPLIFLTMHISMIPLMVTAALIAEEKDKQTLRVLILSNVKPMQYLLGIGSFVFILNIITSCFFLPLLHLQLIFIPKFLLIISLGILCSTILGAIIGVIVKGGSNVAAASTPITILFALVPLLASGSGNGFLASIASWLYSGQLMTIIFDLANNFTFVRVSIMLTNLLILTTVFVFVYNQKKLSD
ncbi:ABC transporter permease [Anaerofustis sp.]|uniref:ABC transporter permease n=1 Tax=Anaerofustis sp. TaxID=1872517 RepID=UPI0025B88BCB|nr:ABC transporter permease [Anaerofustis sp.]